VEEPGEAERTECSGTCKDSRSVSEPDSWCIEFPRRREELVNAAREGESE